MVNNSFITIEWSGYLDFPEGEYLYGSKAGEFISGEFNPEDIVLSKLGSADYAIDPGELTYPVSPEFHFSLNNLDKSTGQQKYPHQYFSKLGRTAEYGGHDDEMGDLFIRVYSPILEKYIYTGFVEGFEYTKFNYELEVSCTDFIKLFDTNDNVFKPYDLGDVKFYLKNRSGSDLSQDKNDIVNKFSPVGFSDVTVNKIVDRNDREINFQQFEIRDGTFLVIEHPDISNDTDHSKKNSILKSVLDGSMSSPYLEGSFWSINASLSGAMSIPEYPEIIKRIFLDNFEEFKISDENISVESGMLTARLSTGVIHLFLQIEDSVILSPCIISLLVPFSETVPVNGAFTSGLSVHWEVSSMHASNGNVETEYMGEDLVVFERGRFLKSEDDPQEAILENEDQVRVVLYDWGRYPADLGKRFFLWNGWESVRHGDLTRFENNYIFHGIYFYHNPFGGILKAHLSNRGRINIIDTIHENVNNKIVQDYILDPYGDFDIFDTSLIMNDNFKTCFVSDVVHYGFADEEIKDVIVNVARQINCYLYSNEEGKITFQPRDKFKEIQDENKVDQFKQILYSDFELTSGKEYGYGKLFYSIEYNDKLEVNNLQSSDSIKRIVGRKGITHRSVSPRSLEISNYRTSDLGVPDGITLAENENVNFPILRDRIRKDQEDHFIMLPEQQAQLFARSYPYPTVILPIRLDVLFNKGMAYNDLSIGSIVYIINENDEYEIFLIKEISYNCHDIYLGGTSTNIKLLQLATYQEIGSDIGIDNSDYFGVYDIVNITEDSY